MNLADVLDTRAIQTETNARTRLEVLAEIARLATKSPALASYTEDDICRALVEREELGTTGFGGGIAIPHCSLEHAQDFVVGIVLSRTGADFDALDGNPVRVFVFIVGPTDRRNEHINILSCISRVLADESAVAELLSASNPEALRENFLRHQRPQLPKAAKEKSLFHVIVQREAVFDDIMEVFSGSVEGNVTVIETQNAGAYLNRMPLFSAFWTDQSKGFCRVIIAAVDKSMANDTVRRINMIGADEDGLRGILVTVQDVTFCAGALDF